MTKIITNEGIDKPNVAKKLPQNPATRKPIYVAALTAIGPGVDSDIASMSRISLLLTHFLFSTTSFWMIGIIA